MAEARRYKAINFDLNTRRLRLLFGESGRSSAYSQVRGFLHSHDFEHRQGSGYRSTRAFSDSEIVDLIVGMYKSFSWLPDCVQKLDVTNIGREYDLDTLAKQYIQNEQSAQEEPLFDVLL